MEHPARADRRVAHARRRRPGPPRPAGRASWPGRAACRAATRRGRRAPRRDRPRRRSPRAPARAARTPATRRPSCCVHRRDLAEVRALRVAAAEGLGRAVGVVRIVVVDPDEERLRATPAPGRRAPASVVSAADALGLPGRQLVVVDVEPAREPEAPRQHEARDEGRGAIAGLLQPLRQDARAPAAAGGRSRGRRARPRRGPSCIEACEGSVSGTVAYAWRKRMPRRASASNAGVSTPAALRADRVGARRVERHEQDRRPSRAAARGRRVEPEPAQHPAQSQAPASRRRADPPCCPHAQLIPRETPWSEPAGAVVLGLRVRALLQDVTGRRLPRRGAGVAEQGRLLICCTGIKPVPGVRIPPSPPAVPTAAVPS